MDNVGIVNYTWTFHDGTANITLYGIAPAHVFMAAGLYHVILNVTDAAGLGDTDSMTIMVDSTPPTANAGPGMIVEEGTVAHFDGSASSDNLGIVRHIWTFNDGTEDVTLQGVFPAHTFTSAGIYLVTLNVTDAAGLWDTDSMTVMVDSTPPTARTGPDQTVDEGGTVVFNGSASTDNVRIVNHAWTFHDGTGEMTLQGVVAAHTFTRPGAFTVTLTVMDGVGQEHSDTMTITVRDITPPWRTPAPT